MIKTNTLLLAPIINFLYAIGLSISLTMFGFQATHTVLEVGMIMLLQLMCKISLDQ